MSERDSPCLSPEARLVFVARPREAKCAVVFVHGLGGHYWRTWGTEEDPGAFLARLREDFPEVAVSAFDYPARLFQFLQDGAATIEDISRLWARELEEVLCRRYHTVAVVGYCLGGTITAMALRQLCARGKKLADRLSVFLLDVPHDWHDSVSVLGQALQIPLDVLRANGQFWKQSQSAKPITISAYAVLSRADSWLISIDPAAGIPAHRVLQTSLTHEQLPRAPMTGPFAPYDFVRSQLHEMVKTTATTVQAEGGCQRPQPQTS